MRVPWVALLFGGTTVLVLAIWAARPRSPARTVTTTASPTAPPSAVIAPPGRAPRSASFVPIASATPTEMTADDERVYWVTCSGSGASSCALLSAPWAGGETSTLTSDLTAPRELRIGGDRIYWLDGRHGLVSIARSGGAQSVHASTQPDARFLSLATGIPTWVEQGDVIELVDGNRYILGRTGESIDALARTAAGAFVVSHSTGQRVLRIPEPRSIKVYASLSFDRVTKIRDMVHDDRFLYWSGADGCIHKLPQEPSSSGMSTPAVITCPGVVDHLGVHDGVLYWTTGAAVFEQPLLGRGSYRRVWVSPKGHVGGLVAGKGALFVAAAGAIGRLTFGAAAD